MTAPTSIRAAFARFADLGKKHAFRLRNGTEFLGWLLEVRDDAVLVSWAPSPFYAQATGTSEMSPPDEWILFADVLPGSLSYWDQDDKRWTELSTR